MEPWDLCGNNIRFLGQEGEFTVPGMYGFFVIRSPNLNVSLRLKIEAVIPCRTNPYFIGNFCLKNNFCSEKVYENIYNHGVIRLVEPQFQQLEQDILSEYHSRIYTSCFPPTLQQFKPFFPTTIAGNEALVFYGGISCDVAYNSLIISTALPSPPDGAITISTVDSSQFRLGIKSDGDRLMRITFSLKMAVGPNIPNPDIECASTGGTIPFELLSLQPDGNIWGCVGSVNLPVSSDFPSTIVDVQNESFEFEHVAIYNTYAIRVYGGYLNTNVNNFIPPPIVIFSALFEDVMMI